MINILKNLFTCALPALLAITATAQVIEIQGPDGKLQFQLVDNQKDITNYLKNAIQQPAKDSVSLEQAVPSYLFSVLTNIQPLELSDTSVLTSTGPHYRGVLTVPIYISPQGKRILQFNHMMVVHGKTYGHSDVKSIHVSFTSDLKKQLYLRLCDTVIKQRYTPLPDSLQDRYGRVDRKKLRTAMDPLLDSLTNHFTAPVYSYEEMMGYEMQGGLPAMDGKYLVIATLTSAVEVLNVNVNSLVNKPTRVAWNIIKP